MNMIGHFILNCFHPGSCHVLQCGNVGVLEHPYEHNDSDMGQLQVIVGPTIETLPWSRSRLMLSSIRLN